MADKEGLRVGSKALSELRVVDLKKELEKRGLSKSGSKKELQERLKTQLHLERLREEASESQGEDEVPVPVQDSQNAFIAKYMQQRQQLLKDAQDNKKQVQEARRRNSESHTSASETEDKPGSGVVSPDVKSPLAKDSEQSNRSRDTSAEESSPKKEASTPTKIDQIPILERLAAETPKKDATPEKQMEKDRPDDSQTQVEEQRGKSKQDLKELKARGFEEKTKNKAESTKDITSKSDEQSKEKAEIKGGSSAEVGNKLKDSTEKQKKQEEATNTKTTEKSKSNEPSPSKPKDMGHLTRVKLAALKQSRLEEIQSKKNKAESPVKADDKNSTQSTGKNKSPDKQEEKMKSIEKETTKEVSKPTKEKDSEVNEKNIEKSADDKAPKSNETEKILPGKAYKVDTPKKEEVSKFDVTQKGEDKNVTDDSDKSKVTKQDETAKESPKVNEPKPEKSQSKEKEKEDVINKPSEASKTSDIVEEKTPEKAVKQSSRNQESPKLNEPKPEKSQSKEKEKEDVINKPSEASKTSDIVEEKTPEKAVKQSSRNQESPKVNEPKPEKSQSKEKEKEDVINKPSEASKTSDIVEEKTPEKAVKQSSRNQDDQDDESVEGIVIEAPTQDPDIDPEVKSQEIESTQASDNETITKSKSGPTQSLRRKAKDQGDDNGEDAEAKDSSRSPRGRSRKESSSSASSRQSSSRSSSAESGSYSQGKSKETKKTQDESTSGESEDEPQKEAKPVDAKLPAKFEDKSRRQSASDVMKETKRKRTSTEHPKPDTEDSQNDEQEKEKKTEEDDSNEIKVPGLDKGSPAAPRPPRKRKWGSTRLARKPAINVSAQTLKGVVDVNVEAINRDPVLELGVKDTESHDEEEASAKIQRTVTQEDKRKVVSARGDADSGSDSSDDVQVVQVEKRKRDSTTIPTSTTTTENGDVSSDRVAPPPTMPDMSKRDDRLQHTSDSDLTDSEEEEEEKPAETKTITRTVHKALDLPVDEPVPVRTGRSPPRRQKSCVVHVMNLVRPFTVPQLKSLMSKYGEIVPEAFWIDKIKSHCFVTYKSEDDASTAREALHGTKWPSSNPKVLQVDFATEEDVGWRQNKDKPPPKATELPQAQSPAKRKRPEAPEVKERSPRRERDQRQPLREWDKDKLRQSESPSPDRKKRRASREGRENRTRSDERERSRDRERKRKRREEKAVEEEEEPPAKLLDDLFKKTKTTPCIYWLPLTEEQKGERKVEKQKKDEERRRRIAEREKQEETEYEQRKKEREEREKKRQKVAEERRRDREKERRRSRSNSRSRSRRR